MGKTCPKCGEYVSCVKWMYCSKIIIYKDWICEDAYMTCDDSCMVLWREDRQKNGIMIAEENLGICKDSCEDWYCEREIVNISRTDLTEDLLNKNCAFCCEGLCAYPQGEEILKMEFNNCKSKSWKCDNYWVEER